MTKEFFPPRPDSHPTIYAYEDTNPDYKGLLKVGYTTVDAQTRVAYQYPTRRPGKLPYQILLEDSAIRNDGTVFTDHEVHRFLRDRGFKNPGGEWYECSIKDVQAAVIALRRGEINEENRSLDFKMRPEQAEAVERTAAYFTTFKKENPDKTPPLFVERKNAFR